MNHPGWMEELDGFPSIFPPRKGFVWCANPWAGTGETPIDWWRENFRRYVFCPSYIMLNAVPYKLNDGPNASGVYFLIFRGEIVYAGKSNQIVRRLQQHSETAELPWTHYWCVLGVPEMFIDDVEMFYINWLLPVLNVSYRGMGEVAEDVLNDLGGPICTRAEAAPLRIVQPPSSMHFSRLGV